MNPIRKAMSGKNGLQMDSRQRKALISPKRKTASGEPGTKTVNKKS